MNKKVMIQQYEIMSKYLLICLCKSTLILIILLKCILSMRRFLCATYSRGRLTTGCPQRGIACMHNYQRSRIVRSACALCVASSVCSSFSFWGWDLALGSRRKGALGAFVVGASRLQVERDAALGGHLKIQYKKERPLKWVCSMHGEQGDASEQNSLPCLPCVHIIRIGSSQKNSARVQVLQERSI